MKNKKSAALLIVSLFCNSAFADYLEPGAHTSSHLREVQNVTLKEASIVESKDIGGAYRGTLKLSLQAEGNICSGRPETLVAFVEPFYESCNPNKLRLFVVQSPVDSICREMSYPVQVTVERKFLEEYGEDSRTSLPIVVADKKVSLSATKKDGVSVHVESLTDR